MGRDVVHTVACTVLGAGLGALNGAVTGVIGATLVGASQIAILEPVVMGAVGGSVVSGLVGTATAVAASKYGLFSSGQTHETVLGLSATITLAHTLNSFIGSLIGYALVGAVVDKLAMSAEEVITTFLYGWMGTSIPVAFLFYLALPALLIYAHQNNVVTGAKLALEEDNLMRAQPTSYGSITSV